MARRKADCWVYYLVVTKGGCSVVWKVDIVVVKWVVNLVVMTVAKTVDL